MSARKAPTWAGHPCPTGGEEHGPLLAVRGVDGFFCPHSEHHGRPKSHPDGPAEQSRSLFAMSEIQIAGSQR